ncbi:MAG TPA: MarR family transcriptional regulator [Micromonosporaceae bacterium]|nr:MarR family transcriptional regulator [Micromonosporaceae bacterium]
MADHVDRVLAQWRVERPDLDPTPMGVVGRISRAARLLERRLSANFARYGLQQHEFDMLATLRRSGHPYRLTAGALLTASMVTSGAITNRVDKLAAKGLVTRETDPSNRRSVLITLTDRGRRLVDEVLVAHVAREAELLAVLTPRDRQQLARILRNLLEALGDTPDP